MGPNGYDKFKNLVDGDGDKRGPFGLILVVILIVVLVFVITVRAEAKPVKSVTLKGTVTKVQTKAKRTTFTVKLAGKAQHKRLANYSGAKVRRKKAIKLSVPAKTNLRVTKQKPVRASQVLKGSKVRLKLPNRASIKRSLKRKHLAKLSSAQARKAVVVTRLASKRAQDDGASPVGIKETTVFGVANRWGFDSYSFEVGESNCYPFGRAPSPEQINQIGSNVTCNMFGTMDNGTKVGGTNNQGWGATGFANDPDEASAYAGLYSEYSLVVGSEPAPLDSNFTAEVVWRSAPFVAPNDYQAPTAVVSMRASSPIPIYDEAGLPQLRAPDLIVDNLTTGDEQLVAGNSDSYGRGEVEGRVSLVAGQTYQLRIPVRTLGGVNTSAAGYPAGGYKNFSYRVGEVVHAATLHIQDGHGVALCDPEGARLGHHEC